VLQQSTRNLCHGWCWSRAWNFRKNGFHPGNALESADVRAVRCTSAVKRCFGETQPATWIDVCEVIIDKIVAEVNNVQLEVDIDARLEVRVENEQAITTTRSLAAVMAG
jgi:hypothetical protein